MAHSKYSLLSKSLDAEDADMDKFRRDVGGAQSLPEQLFGDSFLEVRHQATGLRLRFDAQGALTAWHAQDLCPLQLDHAREWRQSRQANIEANNVATMTYDWWGSCSHQEADFSSGFERLALPRLLCARR